MRSGGARDSCRSLTDKLVGGLLVHLQRALDTGS